MPPALQISSADSVERLIHWVGVASVSGRDFC